jgi:hypothetical protein
MCQEAEDWVQPPKARMPSRRWDNLYPQTNNDNVQGELLTDADLERCVMNLHRTAFKVAQSDS